jgi:hypothetical protein
MNSRLLYTVSLQPVPLGAHWMGPQVCGVCVGSYLLCGDAQAWVPLQEAREQVQAPLVREALIQGVALLQRLHSHHGNRHVPVVSACSAGLSCSNLCPIKAPKSGGRAPRKKKVEGVIWWAHLAQVFEGALGGACTGACKGAGRDVVGRGLGRVDAEVCHAYTTGSRPEQADRNTNGSDQTSVS